MADQPGGIEMTDPSLAARVPPVPIPQPALEALQRLLTPRRSVGSDPAWEADLALVRRHLSQPSPGRPEPSEEIGWLIAFPTGGQPVWWDGRSITTDANKAVRLARREDAETLIRLAKELADTRMEASMRYGIAPADISILGEGKAEEHMWVSRGLPVQEKTDG
jgi:hypothetical protein